MTILEWLSRFNQELMVSIAKDKVPCVELNIKEANILYDKLEEVIKLVEKLEREVYFDWGD